MSAPRHLTLVRDTDSERFREAVLLLGQPASALVARLEPDMPAKVTRPVRARRLSIPQMAPVKGAACCWGCQEGSVHAECLLHAPSYRPV